MALDLEQLKQYRQQRVVAGAPRPKSAVPKKRSLMPWEADPPEPTPVALNNHWKPDDQASTTHRKPDDQASTTHRKPDDQASTTHRKPDDQASTTHRKPDDQASTTHRKPDDQASTTHRKPDDQASTTHRKPDDQASTTHRKPDDQASTTHRKPNDQASTTHRKPNDQASTTHRKPNDQASTTHRKPNDQASTTHRKPDDQASTTHRKPDRQTSESSSKQAKSRALVGSIPRRSIQRDVLVFLAGEIEANGGKPVFMSRRELALKMHISASTVKISLEKLRRKGLLATSDPDYSPKAGGSSYCVPREVLRIVRSEIPVDAEAAVAAQTSLTNQASEASVVSSSYLKTTNYKASVESIACRDIVSRLDLDDRFKISANDLLDAFHSVKLPIEHFIESVEHGSHYVDCPARKKTLKNPKAFLIARLRTRYIEPEPDFVPFDIQQELTIARVAKARAEQRRAVEKERFEAELADYLTGLSDGDRKSILCKSSEGQLHTDTPRSIGAEAVLRAHFANKNHRGHLLDESYN